MVFVSLSRFRVSAAAEPETFLPASNLRFREKIFPRMENPSMPRHRSPPLHLAAATSLGKVSLRGNACHSRAPLECRFQLASFAVSS